MLFLHNMRVDASVKICGVSFENPTILAAGLLGVSASSMIHIIEKGAGGVTIKSLGPEERKGHPCPTIITWEAGMMNAVGLSNPGAEKGIQEIAEFRSRTQAPLVASVFAFKKQDFVDVAEKMSEAGPDFICRGGRGPDRGGGDRACLMAGLKIPQTGLCYSFQSVYRLICSNSVSTSCW